MLEGAPELFHPVGESRVTRTLLPILATLTLFTPTRAADHWAFRASRRPTVPNVRNTTVELRNPIDAFIEAKRRAAKLTASPEADRSTLLRRLTFDLTGLPPTVGEVRAFVADTSPDAYDKVVDRLLASPRHGEKMANLWLDLARFGDTSGYEYDSTRQMWMWRDWVINAYNRNLPFDQFTIEQLAGDLLPNATVAQRIASGFNRNTRFNEEQGSDPEEFVVRYNVDRTATLGQVWLGLTLGCAECHSHKYDPISQREFYQLYAFFTGIKEPFVSGHHNLPLPPLLKFPRPGQEAELAAVARELADIQTRIKDELKAAKYTEPELPAKNPHLVSQKAWEAKARDDRQLPADVKAALLLDPSKRTDKHRAALRNYYLRYVFSGTRSLFEALDKRTKQLTDKQKAIEDSIPYTLVSEEMDKPRPAHVLIRGDFQRRGDKVERNVPAVMPPLPKNAPRNRLGLAQWLVSPEHPLTARVVVNRLWAQLFGTGLVRTIGDFGTQGERPSHLELLDWLATEFVASGWDTKALLRTMALSATYRQSSVSPLNVPDVDPDNRLLSRTARFRHSAEEVRDNALAIAGLLSQRIGGASVMPYQPADFYQGKYEKWLWKVSDGDDAYRRGLYTFWRRTSLHPMFALFDAPSREDCTVARARTNTPLQALVTLNDPTFVAAAQGFAKRILTEGPPDLDGRLAFAFQTALARTPGERELEIVKRRYRLLSERHGKDALSAWTGIASLLLNLDETLTRE